MRKKRHLTFTQKVKKQIEVWLGIRYACCEYYKRNGHKDGCKFKHSKEESLPDGVVAAICNDCRNLVGCVPVGKLQPDNTCKDFINK